MFTMSPKTSSYSPQAGFDVTTIGCHDLELSDGRGCVLGLFRGPALRARFAAQEGKDEEEEDEDKEQPGKNLQVAVESKSTD